MTNLNKMYPGVANSPETFLKENVAPEGTILYVNDASVLGDLPTLAVIGTDQNAETVLVTSKRSDGGLQVQRAVEGLARKWDKATVVARNFTNYDYKQLAENIKKLNDGKVEKSNGESLTPNKFTNDHKEALEKVTMKDTPSADFNAVSKQGLYNGSFSSNCPSGSGKYTLFVYPTDSSTQHRENYMFQFAVKDNTDDTPYFRQRRGSTTWGKWYKYSTNDYSDSAKAKVTAIPPNPKYTDTVTSINGKTGAITKADIVALGIPGQDTNTTYGLASQSSNGLMSAADKKRLDNIKEQVSLTEAQYNALSSSQQNDSKKIYFIKA